VAPFALSFALPFALPFALAACGGERADIDALAAPAEFVGATARADRPLLAPSLRQTPATASVVVAGSRRTDQR